MDAVFSQMDIWLRVYALVLAVLLGAVMGSFLYCFAYRIVHGGSIMKGRSVCDACGHSLGILDLIPLFSFAFSRGKCRYCGAKLSLLYPVTELLGITTFVLTLLKWGISLQLVEYLIFVSILLCASFADLEGYIIPNRLVIAGAVSWLVFYVADVIRNGFVLSDLLDSLIGALAVAGVLLLVSLLVSKLMHRDALGGGDLKLLAMTGLYLGWKSNVLCLLMSAVIGIIFGLIAKKRKKTDNGAFPWGPSIALAAFVCMMCGDALIGAYLALF